MGLVELIYCDFSPVLQHSWDVVENRAEDDDTDGPACLLCVAPACGFQWMAHSNVALDGETHCGVDGACLGCKGQWVCKWMQVWIDCSILTQ